MREAVIICPQCGETASKPISAVNRARSAALPIYCGRMCAVLARRKWKTTTQKKEEKRLYDIHYRETHDLRAKKAAYFERTYDPSVARIARRVRAAEHAEYCRQPQYKAYKQRYDRSHRAKKYFGDFSEAFLLLQNLVREINDRSSDYERRVENQTYGKSQRRRRDYTRTVGRESKAGPLGDIARN